MFDHLKTKGVNKGKRGYGWPNMRIRWCTSELKTKQINKYLRGVENIRYTGIAYDEPLRHTKAAKNVRHLLYEWGVTENQALQYCYKNGFTWGGLYEHFDRLSCWCCPLKNQSELRILYRLCPELWGALKEMDSRAYNQFKDKGVQYFEDKFALEVDEGNLFAEAEMKARR